MNFKVRAMSATLVVAFSLQSLPLAAFAQDDVSDGISNLYSDIDTRLRMATKPDSAPCVDYKCEENRVFDSRIGAIGSYLSKAAAIRYPERAEFISHFTFSVADKSAMGTASNNRGNVFILRGLQTLDLSDDALAFIMAREMGHVLAGHHVSNTSTKLIITALASVLFPAAAIIGAGSTAAQASTATTLITSAASTATSVIGGEVALAKMKPSQLVEADEIALKILETSGWDMRSAKEVLIMDDAPQTAWIEDLEQSRQKLEKLIQAEEMADPETGYALSQPTE